MLTIYGPTRSRASRALWMLEECGVPYEHEDLSQYPTMEEKAAATRKIYALGKVPFLKDGELLLAESMAINIYVARTYGKHLWPKSEADQARALQWSFFAVTEIDPPLVQLLIERAFRREADRNAENEKKNAELIKRPLAYLEPSLGNRPYLLGQEFTVADLNVACIFSMAAGAKLDLAPYPAVNAWTERCLGRPARMKVAGAKPPQTS
jgi:glutathione S-transferase